MNRRTSLKRGGRLRPVSKKRQRGRSEWAKVYREVDQRSKGRCEVVLADVVVWRCDMMATEHHHTLKPRASHNTPNAVIHVCNFHHSRVDWPYKFGRLRILPLGHGVFMCWIAWARDKFAARAAEAV